MKEQIPYAERTYLAVPYEERDQAKAVGARWDAVKKAWYIGPGVESDKVANWAMRHQEPATLDPRAELAMLSERQYREYEIVHNGSGLSEEMSSDLSTQHQREWQNFEKQAQAAVEQQIHL